MTDREVQLAQGTIRYRESGAGPTIVLLHGLLIDGRFWRKVVPHLENDHRVIVPDLPLGAHRVPLAPEADRSPTGIADLIADFLDALDLRDVTLVGNDTGGVLAQLVATRRPERIGRLVLTPCDAFDNFLPKMFKPLEMAAKVPGGLTAAVAPLRFARARRLPMTFGRLAKRPIDKSVGDAWLSAYMSDKGVRHDCVEFVKAISPRITEQAARDLASFDKPTLVAWASEDRIFPFEHAERLAQTIPNARLERIEDSYSFVPEDNPERTAQLISGFVRDTTGAAAPA